MRSASRIVGLATPYTSISSLSGGRCSPGLTSPRAILPRRSSATSSENLLNLGPRSGPNILTAIVVLTVIFARLLAEA